MNKGVVTYYNCQKSHGIFDVLEVTLSLDDGNCGNNINIKLGGITMFDVLIKNGQVVDGTGNPWFKADIGIENGKIECISRSIYPSRAEKIIDANGLTVSPGFIDTHSHEDLYLLEDRPIEGEGKVLQGVTTLIDGNCGYSVPPILSKENGKTMRDVLALLGGYHVDEDRFNCPSFKDYLEKLNDSGLRVNVATLIGHASVRIAVIGMEQRAPTHNELEQMKNLVEKSMEEGAYGMSTGLFYTPASCATTSEVIELAKVVARYDGIYASHIRNESNMLLPSVAEAIRIGKESGCPVHISHFKVMGKQNWGKSSQSLAMLEDAAGAGVEVTCDQYPYTAGCTFLMVLLPPAILEGGPAILQEKLKDSSVREKIIEELENQKGQYQNVIKEFGWENIVISCSTSCPDYQGKSIMEISTTYGKNPYDVVFDTIIAEGQNTGVWLFCMCEEDIERILCNPLTMAGSDGVPYFGDGRIHPRLFGTFSKILGEYVREKKLLTLPDAIRKMTSLPAQTFGLQTKGVLRRGLDADVVIFDAEKVIDKATYDNPMLPPVGINYVIVNGKIAVQDGELTDVVAGRALRYKG